APVRHALPTRKLLGNLSAANRLRIAQAAKERQSSRHDWRRPQPIQPRLRDLSVDVWIDRAKARIRVALSPWPAPGSRVVNNGWLDARPLLDDVIVLVGTARIIHATVIRSEAIPTVRIVF